MNKLELMRANAVSYYVLYLCTGLTHYKTKAYGCANVYKAYKDGIESETDVYGDVELIRTAA